MHPREEEPEGADRVRPLPVQRTQCCGAFLCPNQAVPTRGHPLRQNGEELPGVRLGRFAEALACLNDPASINRA